MAASARVARTLEDVYATFATKRKPRRIDACPCCHDSKDLCTLLATPLRELTPEQLSRYASSVFLTAGSESDFRYFLPRILEISVRDGSWWPGREVVLGKLTLADWKAWPEHLRDPVIRLCEAAFDEALRQADDPGGQIDSWICGLSRAGLDVLPYLEKLRAPGAEKALIGFFEANSAALLRGKLANAFWKDEKADPAPVIAWLNSPDVQSAVWSHYGANPR